MILRRVRHLTGQTGGEPGGEGAYLSYITERTFERDEPPMNITAKLRARRVEARNRKAIARAINQAPSQSMRHELMAIAQNQVTTLR
jgi:hypothetical protein